MTDGFVVADLLFFSSNICFTSAAGASAHTSPRGALPNSTGNTEQSYSEGISGDKQNLVCKGTYECG